MQIVQNNEFLFINCTFEIWFKDYKYSVFLFIKPKVFVHLTNLNYSFYRNILRYSPIRLEIYNSGTDYSYLKSYYPNRPKKNMGFSHIHKSQISAFFSVTDIYTRSTKKFTTSINQKAGIYIHTKKLWFSTHQ